VTLTIGHAKKSGNPNFASDRRYDLKEGFLHVREDFSVDEKRRNDPQRRRR
jgi:hypothetical protein